MEEQTVPLLLSGVPPLKGSSSKRRSTLLTVCPFILGEEADGLVD
jgi:hypothetical protein